MPRSFPSLCLVAVFLTVAACGPTRDDRDPDDGGQVDQKPDAGDGSNDAGNDPTDGGGEPCHVSRCEDGIASSCDGSDEIDCSLVSAECATFSTIDGPAQWCSCGDVTEAGRCLDDETMVACNEGALEVGKCPEGSVCGVGEGAGCYCDDLDDGLCPDPDCTEDPDCSVCTPECAGLECGDDGCGGTCGTCSGTDTCEEGECVAVVVSECEPGCAATEVCANSMCVATRASTKLYPTVTGTAIDFVYDDSDLYVVALTDKRYLYRCSATGCSGSVLSLGEIAADAPLPIVERAGDKLFWLKSKTELRERDLTSQTSSTRQTELIGTFTTGLVPGGASLFFGLDRSGFTPAIFRLPVASGDSVATSLEATRFNVIRLTTNSESLVFWQEGTGATPITMRHLSNGSNTTLGSHEAITSLAAIATSHIFWTKRENSTQALYGCAVEEGCTEATLVKGPVGSVVAAEGDRVFFNGVVGTNASGLPAWGVLSCAAAEALAGTCEPRVEIVEAGLAWHGLRRLRVDAEWIYGINENGQLRRVAREL